MLQTTDGATMPMSVWTSTLNRTIQTAEGLPFPKLRWKVRPCSAGACCMAAREGCSGLQTPKQGACRIRLGWRAALLLIGWRRQGCSCVCGQVGGLALWLASAAGPIPAGRR